MKPRVLKAASLVSAVLAGCTLALWLTTFLVTPWDHRISFSPGFHVGVWSGPSGDTLGRLVIFNSAEHGPYRGSTIQIVDDRGNVSPRLDRKIAWGDTCGVYYRYFRWPGGTDALDAYGQPLVPSPGVLHFTRGLAAAAPGR